MPTFKPEVQYKKKTENTYSVAIRCTHNRVKKYIPTNFKLEKDDVTKGLKIKNQSVIDALDDLIRKYRKVCNNLGEQLSIMTADQIKEYLINLANKDKFHLDFIAFGRKKVEELKNSGRSGSAINYDTTLNSLVRYIERDHLDISEINASFLKKYKAWLNSQPSLTKKKKGTRAESLYLSAIRAIHNFAKDEYNDEERGVIRIPYSPFSKFRVPKPPATRKRALSCDILKDIVALPYEAETKQKVSRYNLAKDVFILSFCLVGMNSVDLFNCPPAVNGRLTYNRYKTKDRREDKAEISIKIEPEIQHLIEKYKDNTGARAFNFYKRYSTPGTFNTALNKGLKKIGSMLHIEDLEFYAARHSWATIAVNDAKIDKYTVHTALNHVDEGMRVTDIYITKDYSLIDEANRRVLDFMQLNIGSVLEFRKHASPASKKPVG